MGNVTVISAIVLAFILADLLTGLLAALKNKEFKSAVMREGLFHKLGELAAYGLALMCDIFGPYVHIELPVDLATAVASYLAIMEIGSILENISKLSPEAASIFSKINKKENNNDT